jgi:hypothetical protein
MMTALERRRWEAKKFLENEEERSFQGKIAQQYEESLIQRALDRGAAQYLEEQFFGSPLD